MDYNTNMNDAKDYRGSIADSGSAWGLSTCYAACSDNRRLLATSSDEVDLTKMTAE